MAMECRPDNGWKVFQWEMKQNMSIGLVTIFRNYNRRRELDKNYSTRFGVDMDERCSGLLYTNETQLDDAGLYFCRIERSIEPAEQNESSAHLIVLGKNKLSMVRVVL